MRLCICIFAHIIAYVCKKQAHPTWQMCKLDFEMLKSINRLLSGLYSALSKNRST